jgi:hypothetical protein
MNKHNNYAIRVTKTAIIVAVFATIYFAFQIIGGSKNDNTTKVDYTITMPCSDREATTILEDASTALDPARPENINNLGPIAETVMGYTNYQDDTNCLYILATRYVYISDYINAKKYLDLLLGRQGSGGGTALPRNFLTIYELNKNIEFLSRKADEIKRNSQGSAI